jgi:recombination protein RecA
MARSTKPTASSSGSSGSTTGSGKDKALETTLSNLTRRFGDGIIMKLGDATKLDVESIPTGSLSLDIALGVGGMPRGRIIEIYGPESSGKTTICLHVIAEAQRNGGVCGFVDVEHALDPAYARRIGVDVDNLYVSQPDTGEQALEITEALVRSGAMDVVVVDSVAALVPRAEIEGEMGDSHVGLQARLMSQALRKLVGAVKTSGTCMVFTNQLRQKIGVMFGNPETTSGGMALKFYASVRLDIRRIQSIKQGNDVIGNRTRITVRKNKVAPPFRVAEFDIMYNEGISTEGDLIDLGVEHDVIDKRGAYYRFNEEIIGQGRENAKVFLQENPEIAKQIDAKLRATASLPVNFSADAEGEPAAVDGFDEGVAFDEAA